MCLGLPMTVVDGDDFSALCEWHGETRRVSTLLVGRQAPGARLLVHLDSAIRVLDDAGNPTATGLEEFIKSNVLDNKDNAPFIIAGRASGGGTGGANAGGGSGAGKKTITLAAFNNLPHAERHAFMNNGGHIED